jgi:signal transduction histidine kinase
VVYERNEAIFSVQDTGVGIAEKDIPLIFDRFHRVEAMGVSRMGTGIGLSREHLFYTNHNELNVSVFSSHA